MEFHYERFVKVRITKQKKIFVILLFIAALIGITLVGLASLIFLKLPAVGLGLMCLLAWLLYLYLTRLNVEYEYQLTGTSQSVELDIAKIVNGKKRHELFSVNCKEAEIIARSNGPKDSDAYRKLHNRYECVKSMDQPDVFFIVTNTEKGRAVIYVQLDEEMIEGLQKTIPSRFFA